MFKVKIRSDSIPRSYTERNFFVSSLSEAELKAFDLVKEHFQTDSIVVVHRAELVYDIYQVVKRMGQVKIISI